MILLTGSYAFICSILFSAYDLIPTDLTGTLKLGKRVHIHAVTFTITK